MEKIVIFGKGGSGKTIVSTNLSTILSMEGRRVLHVGCDPKRDSLFCLVDELGYISPVEMIMAGAEVKTPADIIIKGRAGMDCVDCGGMEPGHGCGGRGVTLTIDTLQRLGMFQNEAYDAVVLDVLGDLVCGGFAAVLKKGVGEKVLVVVSGDFMSLFAANNICKAILAFWENGIYLTGLIANLAGTRGEVSVIHRFAKNLSTTVLGVIPHERLISEAEYHRQTVVEYRPGSKAAAIFKEIAKKVLSAGAREARKPTPMDDAWLQEFCREEFNFRSRRRGNRKGRT